MKLSGFNYDINTFSYDSITKEDKNAILPSEAKTKVCANDMNGISNQLNLLGEELNLIISGLNYSNLLAIDAKNIITIKLDYETLIENTSGKLSVNIDNHTIRQYDRQYDSKRTIHVMPSTFIDNRTIKCETSAENPVVGKLKVNMDNDTLTTNKYGQICVNESSHRFLCNSLVDNGDFTIKYNDVFIDHSGETHTDARNDDMLQLRLKDTTLIRYEKTLSGENADSRKWFSRLADNQDILQHL